MAFIVTLIAKGFRWSYFFFYFVYLKALLHQCALVSHIGNGLMEKFPLIRELNVVCLKYCSVSFLGDRSLQLSRFQANAFPPKSIFEIKEL